MSKLTKRQRASLSENDSSVPGSNVKEALDSLDGLSHTQNTDTFLSTMTTNVLHVDNKRTDSYLENGSITKPFKTIQAAHDSIVGNTSTNKFEIKVARGAAYSEPFAYSKDYVMLSSVGLGASLTGAITITSPHPTFVGFEIKSAVTLSLASHFCINVINCRVTTGIWNITATAPTGDEYLQVLGNDMWTSQLNATGITGVVGWSGGIIFSGPFNLTNCYFQASGTDIEGMTINLESGTDAYLGAILAIDATVNLKVGATLNTDVIFLGGITLVNTGGILNLTSKASGVDNDSLVPGNTVKDALENVQGQVKSIVQQSTRLVLDSDDTWEISNASDPEKKRILQVSAYTLRENSSLDFDTTDEGSFTQENAAETDFVSNKVQLHLDAVIDNIYAHYHLNELSGVTVLDSSDNNRHGVTVGTPDIIDGKLNKAKHFIPADEDYVNLSNIASFNINTVFSIEAWVKTTNGEGTYHAICSKFDINTSTGYIFSIYGGRLDLTVQEAPSAGFWEVWTTPINDGNWHHVLVNYNGSGLPTGVTLYVDGIDATDGTWSNGVPVNTILNSAFCSIGSTEGQNIFDGDIDEVVIYKDFNLTPAQIAFRYNAGSGRENMGTYDTSGGWYVMTNTNQINTSAWTQFIGIEFTEEKPTGTQIRYLISHNNKVGWYRWATDHWNITALGDIDTLGNTAEELEALTSVDWSALYPAPTFDIVASLKSIDSTQTPKLDQITIQYLNSNKNIVTSQAEVFFEDTKIYFKNVSGSTMYELVANVLLP